MGVKYNKKTAVEGKVKTRSAAHRLFYQVYITLPEESWVKVRENTCVYNTDTVRALELLTRGRSMTLLKA